MAGKRSWVLHQLGRVLFITLCLLPIGPLTVYFIYRPESAPLNIYLAALTSTFKIAFIVFALEMFLLSRKIFRRMSFSIYSLIRTVFYVIIISIALYLNRLAFGIKDIAIDPSSSAFFINRNFIVSFSLAIVLAQVGNFVIAVNRILGQNLISRFFFNRYHRPREKVMIFMFLDIKSSTTIAEKIGHLKFHSMINDFFFAISRSVIATRGKIYKYVGDEVIITWDIRKGIRNNNCIDCHFEIADEIHRQKNYFKKKYGVVPEFKSGLHAGPAIVGEMGDLLQEVAYLGDTVNTTARIQGECNKFKTDLLVSESLSSLLDLGHGYKCKALGKIKLKGKQKGLELITVKRL